MKRRNFLAVTGATLASAALGARSQGLAPPQDISPLLAKITGGAAAQRAGVEVEMPSLAENGNSVPLRIRIASPMTAADHVKAIHVFAERNPRPHVATFHLGPYSGRAEVSTRVRLAGSQQVTVLAELSGQRFLIGPADVVVTSSACLDEDSG